MSVYECEENPDHGAPEPAYQQPCRSPPLLLGAVCKQWRKITLETSQLWTNIIVDLEKPTNGQLDMVKEWAHRSGVLPPNITVFPGEEHRQKYAPFDRYEDMISALRSLAVRWNDVALHVPSVMFHRLLNNLPEAPHIGSMFFPASYYSRGPFDMQYLLHPRRLISKYFYEDRIFEWDHLVFLEIERVGNDSGILDIIRHAPNLRYCIARCSDKLEQLTTPTSPITNCSLVYFQTSCDIFGYLTLPSLLHLDYDQFVLDQRFESLVGFLDRSCAPLPSFSLRCYIWGSILFPRFEGLAAVTHLSLDIDPLPKFRDPAKIDDFLHALVQSPPSMILPHVKILEIELDDLLTSSWSLFSQLFAKDAGTDSADIEADSIAIKRPFLRVSVFITRSDEVTMDKNTFLRLLEVKKSGVDLSLNHHIKGDLFSPMV